MQKTVFLLFTLSIITLAVLHALALTFYLYWVYLWFDIPMHVLGGATIALGYQSRFLISRFAPALSFSLWGTVAAALFVGGLWEAYEYAVDPSLTIDYAFDTALDFAMDVVGAAIGYSVAKTVQKL